MIRNHADLGSIADESRLYDEVVTATREMEKLIDRKIRYFAFPFGLPEQLTENPPRLLTALHDAMLTTDPDPVRFATDHIQVRGKSGTVVATDGRQMLIQDGFEFPWDDDILLSLLSVSTPFS